VHALVQEPPTSKKPSMFTFYDNLRIYTTARHFLEAVSSNPDYFLPESRHSSIFSTSAASVDTEIDPLAPNSMVVPPLLPTPPSGEVSTESLRNAIDTITDFIAVLGSFGQRFGNPGGLSLRDKFAKEAQPLLAQLTSKLQQQQQTSNFWAQGPVTPQNNFGSSPRRSGGFYPSPATTQCSPGHVPQELDTASFSNWNVRQDSIQPHPYTTTSIDFSVAPLTAPVPGNEFGIIGSGAAWETLPGGNLNARFG